MKLNKQIKKLFKDMERAKQYCAKTYPDWNDDCFNALENKFIWGFCKNKHIEPSFCTWNDAQVYYNRATKKYYLDIDTGIFIEDIDAETARVELERLEEIKKAFRNFLRKSNLRTDALIPCFFNPDFQLSLDGESLTQLYVKFCILLEGYKWYRNQNQQEI